jgi:hypothetical protein
MPYFKIVKIMKYNHNARIWHLRGGYNANNLKFTNEFSNFN